MVTAAADKSRIEAAARSKGSLTDEVTAVGFGWRPRAGI